MSNGIVRLKKTAQNAFLRSYEENQELTVDNRTGSVENPGKQKTKLTIRKLHNKSRRNN